MPPVNWRHALQARVAFVDALFEEDFAKEWQRFAADHQPPKFRLDDAVAADPAYGKALAGFVGRWGLAAPWFREYCHDFAWRSHDGSPQKFYGHPLAPPFGRMVLRLEFDALEEVEGRPFIQDARQPLLWAGALWLDDTRTQARQHVIDQFERVWDERIAPARASRGGQRSRTRSHQERQRDARAYVARAIVRRSSSHPVRSATLERMQQQWPGQYENWDDDAVAKALTNFGRLLRASEEFLRAP